MPATWASEATPFYERLCAGLTGPESRSFLTRAPVHMHHMLRIGFLLGAVMLVQPAHAQSDAGREVYAENCAQCHGERLMATGAAPDLKQLRADQRERFDTIVRDGKGQMPAWGGMITDEQIDQVWAYVRSRAEN
jgi:mono/diheme cytochrome c family protein